MLHPATFIFAVIATVILLPIANALPAGLDYQSQATGAHLSHPRTLVGRHYTLRAHYDEQTLSNPPISKTRTNHIFERHADFPSLFHLPRRHDLGNKSYADLLSNQNGTPPKLSNTPSPTVIQSASPPNTSVTYIPRTTSVRPINHHRKAAMKHGKKNSRKPRSGLSNSANE